MSDRSLILCGMKGSGKSFWGERLAAKLAWPFFDTDRAVESVYAQEQGVMCSCFAIVQREGELFFRALERKVTLAWHPENRCVVATGGGTLLDPSVCAHLAHFGDFLHLQTAKELCQQRTTQYMFDFDRIWRERERFYEELTERRVAMTSDEEIMKQLCAYAQ